MFWLIFNYETQMSMLKADFRLPHQSSQFGEIHLPSLLSKSIVISLICLILYHRLSFRLSAGSLRPFLICLKHPC